MKNTYTYQIQDQAIAIQGFIAALLEQGEKWDLRCIEADMQDYHQEHYARMDSIEALKQEFGWWLDFYTDERLDNIPQCDDLMKAGVSYLLWRVHQSIEPLNEAEKRSINMQLHIDGSTYLYKDGEVMGLSEGENPKLGKMMHGFVPQLLSHSACTTAYKILHQTPIADLDVWVDVLWGWLQPIPIIRLQYVQLDVADVRELYKNHVAEKQAFWELCNKKLYGTKKPQLQSFMNELLKNTKIECKEAIELIGLFLSEQQKSLLMHYTTECHQYIEDLTTTCKAGRSVSLDAYWCKGIKQHLIPAAIRGLKKAVAKPNPAKALAEWVMQKQKAGILIQDIKPYTRFVAAVNKVCGTRIKSDTLSKHFREN